MFFLHHIRDVTPIVWAIYIQWIRIPGFKRTSLSHSLCRYFLVEEVHTLILFFGTFYRCTIMNAAFYFPRRRPNIQSFKNYFRVAFEVLSSSWNARSTSAERRRQGIDGDQPPTNKKKSKLRRNKQHLDRKFAVTRNVDFAPKPKCKANADIERMSGTRALR